MGDALPVKKTETQINQFLSKLAQSGFCGGVELSYSNGEVMRIRMNQTIVPSELDKVGAKP